MFDQGVGRPVYPGTSIEEAERKFEMFHCEVDAMLAELVENCTNYPLVQSHVLGL